MKNLLYIGILPLLISITTEDDISDTTDEFHLIGNAFDKNLIAVDKDFIPGDNKFGISYNFTKKISIPLQKLQINNAMISSPFLLRTNFKLNEKFSTTCLFSFVDKRTTQFELCFIPTGEDTISIQVNGVNIPKKKLEWVILQDLTEWTEILIHFEDTKATLYVSCTEPGNENGETNVFEEGLTFKEIEFTEESTLVLGNFQGVVQEIEIYLSATEDKKDSFCVFKLPDSPPSKDDEDDDPDVSKGDGDSPKPMNLESFTGDTSPEIGLAETGEKGDKGEKGEKGIGLIGPQGPQGSPGPPGLMGPPGKKGDIGSCSCSESVISSLLKTMPEMKGPKGERGERGDVGDPGPAGLTGSKGEKGERGLQGIKGDQGDKGDDGSPGKDGSRGPKGEPGADGKPGSKGDMGPPGPPGPGYEKGSIDTMIPVPGQKGDQGPIGPPGPKGSMGDKGEMGSKGDRGHKGDMGHPGPKGGKGDTGERGESGKDGVPGIPGARGMYGDKGDKGASGEKGVPGTPGRQALLTDLLESEMDPAEKAAVIEILRGPKGNKGADGKKGEKGDIGPMGPQGENGRTGHGERGHPGPKGDRGPEGPQGLKGEPGEPGNSLFGSSTATKGPKGDKGDRGPIGKSGPKGPTGPAGKRGPVGPTGPKGNRGAPGPQGPVGPAGPRGENGLMGPKGEKGDSAPLLNLTAIKGEKGERGIDGKPGPPGIPGPCSTSGPTPKTHDVHYLEDDDDFYTTATVVYRSITALVKRTSSTPPGTLAYVLREQTLLLRVQNGWQYVTMGSLLQADPYATTTYRPLPSRLEASTLPTLNKPKPDHIYIRLAALNTPYSGNIESVTNRTGRNAANLDCHIQSRGYEGNFVAFLAGSVEDLRNIVKIKKEKISVVNLKGEFLFNSWSDIFTGSGAPFIQPMADIYSFNGKKVMIDNTTWPIKAVWHGGDVFGLKQSSAYCNEWQSDSPEQYGAASPLHTHKLLGQQMYPCDSKLIVLCIEATRRRQRHSGFRIPDHFNRVRTFTLKNRIPR